MPIRPFGINPGQINWFQKGATKGSSDSQAIPFISRPTGGLVVLVVSSIVINGNLPFLTSSWLGLSTYLINRAQRSREKFADYPGRTIDPPAPYPSPVERYPPGWEKTVDIGDHWNNLRTNPMKHGTLPQ